MNVSDREDISTLLHLSNRLTDRQIRLAIAYIQGIIDTSSQ